MNAVHEMVAVNVVVLWLAMATIAVVTLRRRSAARQAPAAVRQERVGARSAR